VSTKTKMCWVRRAFLELVASRNVTAHLRTQDHREPSSSNPSECGVPTAEPQSLAESGPCPHRMLHNTVSERHAYRKIHPEVST